MFKVIELSNFRGFESAQLANLSRVNFITGLNGAGKSSLLEAAFLICGAANASLVASLYTLRGEAIAGPKVDRVFRSLFRGLDPSILPRIVASSSMTMKSSKRFRRELTIHPVYSVSPGQATTQQKKILSGVEFSFSGPSGAAKNTWGWRMNTGSRESGNPSDEVSALLGGRPSENPDLVNAHLVSPYINFASGQSHDGLTKAITARRHDEVIEALRIIVPTIRSLHPIVQDDEKVILADVGEKELLPLSVLGSGVAHFLSAILPLALLEKGVVLLDELEDGIHHSLFRPLLETIFRLSSQRGNQVFITTHSLELLRAAIEVGEQLTASESAAEQTSQYGGERVEARDIAFYRLGKRGLKGAIPRYSISQAQELVDLKLDLR